jgi:hypothetical protein
MKEGYFMDKDKAQNFGILLLTLWVVASVVSFLCVCDYERVRLTTVFEGTRMVVPEEGETLENEEGLLAGREEDGVRETGSPSDPDLEERMEE